MTGPPPAPRWPPAAHRQRAGLAGRARLEGRLSRLGPAPHPQTRWGCRLQRRARCRAQAPRPGLRPAHPHQRPTARAAVRRRATRQRLARSQTPAHSPRHSRRRRRRCQRQTRAARPGLRVPGACRMGWRWWPAVRQRGRARAAPRRRGGAPPTSPAGRPHPRRMQRGRPFLLCVFAQERAWSPGGSGKGQRCACAWRSPHGPPGRAALAPPPLSISFPGAK